MSDTGEGKMKGAMLRPTCVMFSYIKLLISLYCDHKEFFNCMFKEKHII